MTYFIIDFEYDVKSGDADVISALSAKKLKYKKISSNMYAVVNKNYFICHDINKCVI